MLAFFPLLYYHAACRVLTPIITQQEKEIKMNLNNKQEIIKEYGKNEKDTGSTAVQVAMMSKKISELTEHLKSNQKDFATKRPFKLISFIRARIYNISKLPSTDVRRRTEVT